MRISAWSSDVCSSDLEGVAILEMDFMDDAAPDALIAALGSAPDLVLSDMAANTVGHSQTDHLRTIALAETAADFAVQTLQPGRSEERSVGTECVGTG